MQIKGKRDHRASGKTPVFVILQLEGAIFTEIVPDCSKATLQAAIRGRVCLEIVIHPDN